MSVSRQMRAMTSSLNGRFRMRMISATEPPPQNSMAIHKSSSSCGFQQPMYRTMFGLSHPSSTRISLATSCTAPSSSTEINYTARGPRREVSFTKREQNSLEPRKMHLDGHSLRSQLDTGLVDGAKGSLAEFLAYQVRQREKKTFRFSCCMDHIPSSKMVRGSSSLTPGMAASVADLAISPRARFLNFRRLTKTDNQSINNGRFTFW